MQEAEATPKKTAKRAAAPVPRYGLIHIAGFQYQSPLPADLVNIQYSAMVIEAGESNFTEGVHPQVTRLLQRGVPALVCGTRQDVTELMQFIRDSLDEVHVYDMELAKPAKAGDGKAGYYRYRRYRVVIIMKQTLAWKVCNLQLLRLYAHMRITHRKMKNSEDIPHCIPSPFTCTLGEPVFSCSCAYAHRCPSPFSFAPHSCRCTSR